MISICQAYNDFKGANNTFQQGHFRPNSFEYALYEASLEMFNERKKAIGNNQDITDELRPFLKSVQVAIEHFPKGGIVKYPKDYSRFEALRYYVADAKSTVGVSCSDLKLLEPNGKCRPLREEEKLEAELSTKLIEKKIDKLDAGQWASFCEHEFLGPNNGHVGCTQLAEGFIVKPEEIGYVVFDFLAIPERPKFAYTRDAKHNIICVPAKCKDLLWNAELLPELMSRVKSKYGSFIGNERKYNEGKQDLKDAQ
jgi:hypothetical protein